MIGNNNTRKTGTKKVPASHILLAQRQVRLNKALHGRLTIAISRSDYVRYNRATFNLSVTNSAGDYVCQQNDILVEECGYYLDGIETMLGLEPIATKVDLTAVDLTKLDLSELSEELVG